MNENHKHESTKKKLKIIGFIIVGAGLALSVTGLVSFFSAFRTGSTPDLFFCAIIGFPLLGIGASILSFAFKREIMRYAKNESVPVINEASGDSSESPAEVISFSPKSKCSLSLTYPSLT